MILPLGMLRRESAGRLPRATTRGRSTRCVQLVSARSWVWGLGWENLSCEMASSRSL